jgi:hypothetical protein
MSALWTWAGPAQPYSVALALPRATEIAAEAGDRPRRAATAAHRLGLLIP